LRIEEILLAKTRKYDSLNGSSDGPAIVGRPMAGVERRKIFCPGGHDNRLNRLISDKEIQGNPSLFLGNIGLKLGPAGPDLGKFGFGLDTVIKQEVYV
jgi:hypothetical protein